MKKTTIFTQFILCCIIAMFSSCNSDSDFATGETKSSTLKSTAAKPHFDLNFTVKLDMTPWGSPGDTYYEINGIASNNPNKLFPENIGFNFTVGLYSKSGSLIGNELHTWKQSGNPFPNTNLSGDIVRQDNNNAYNVLLSLMKGFTYGEFPYEIYEGYEAYDFSLGTMMLMYYFPEYNNMLGEDVEKIINYSGFTNDVIVDVTDSNGNKATILSKSYSNYNGTINFETQSATYTINLVEYLNATHPYGLPRYKVVVNP